MATLYPFSSHYHLRHNLRMHYLDEGSGDPIVMVHGNPTWSFYYRNLILGLRNEYRCIVPDHIGCGLSDKPSPDRYDYSLRSRIDDLESLLDSLNIKDRITLIVHDWGGMIGMGYGVRQPQRIARLIILNTGAFPLPKTKRFPFSLWLGRNTWLGAWLIRRWNLFCRKAVKVCVTRKSLPDDVRAMYLKPYDSWANRIAVLRFVQTIPLRESDPGYDIVSEVEKGLSQFQSHPMLICWGMKDFVFDHHFLAEWEKHFPQAEVHRFEDCGHYILEDAPEEVLEYIKGFLKRHPASSDGQRPSSGGTTTESLATE